MIRRHFLRALGGGALGAAVVPRSILADDEIRLVVLHTNDTHSRIDPFPEGSGGLSGLGGVARRATLVQRVRDEEEHVLLFDSGDMVQGTPYFNLFKGEVEMRTMSALRYDLSTLGNHDFDNGVDGLVSMLEFAEFPLACANYRIEDSRLAPRVQPSRTFAVAGQRIGVFGLGINFRGLVLDHNHEGVFYEDPIAAARTRAEALRREGCAAVICLSHLGHEYRDDRPSDVRLAAEVPAIDVILGGHTHTFLDDPHVHEHPDGSRTLVHQVGWGGVRLGRIDLTLSTAGELRRVGAAGYRVDGRLG
ncbi:MAG: metallophosphatase [Gemmatimonadota bacterium]